MTSRVPVLRRQPNEDAGETEVRADLRKSGRADTKKESKLNYGGWFATVLVAALICVMMNLVSMGYLKGVSVSTFSTSYSLERPGWRSKRALTDPFWDQFCNISIVYTWVNGSDPDFRELRRQNGKKGSESRYRETEELLHSFRSLAANLPWHNGTIFIVAPGHWPTWLNKSHPRVKLVDQNSIIQKDAQPAFNSAVIEQNMHRIEGLTDIFVHMNDDYIIGRPMHQSDLITDDGGIRLYHEGNTVNGGTDDYKRLKRLRQKQWLGSVYHTIGMLSDRHGYRTRKFVKHAPFVYSKKAFAMMWDIWPKELTAASKMKFRYYDDVLIPFLHHNLVIEKGAENDIRFSNHVGNRDLDAQLCIVKDDYRAAYKKMAEHVMNPHMFFTVNDGWNNPESGELVKAFLHRIYPFPSEFELDGARSVKRPDIAAWSESLEIMSRRLRKAVQGTLKESDSAAALQPVTTPKPKLKIKLDGLDSSCGTCSGNGVCTEAGCVCHNGWLGMDCDYPHYNGTKTYEVLPGCSGFDVVFTWVNGSDPALIEQTIKYSQKREDKRKSRTRDTGQLRYGLRSVRKFMPWVRHIWVVSGTPKPDWLNDSNPYVSYVPHSAIFSGDELPQLNSNSIQSRLWSIPHLALRYLSMDDDFMVVRPTPPSAVLGDNLLSTVQYYRVKFRASAHKTGPYKDSLVHTKKVVENYFRLPEMTWLSQAHVPPVFDKILQAEVRREFAEEFKDLNRNKFRTPRDFEPNFGYAWFMQSLSEDVLLGTSKLVLGGLETSLGDVGITDIMCRIAGQHPAKWSEKKKKELGELLTPVCTEAAASGVKVTALKESCREDITQALNSVVKKYSTASSKQGYFTMVKDTTDTEKMYSRLSDGVTRFACLNDDYSEKVSPIIIDKLIFMLQKIVPKPAPWELDSKEI